MSEENEQQDDGGEVVYRRLPVTKVTSGTEGTVRAHRSTWKLTRNLAPTLKPLFVGFVLLLVLIGSLGYFSTRELDNVETGTTILQVQYTNKIQQLLDLHAAAIRLNSETRIRSRAELRGEITPPFEVPISNARGAVEAQIEKLQKMPFAKEDNWRILSEHLVLYLETTKDRKVYSLKGYAQFRVFEEQIDVIQRELKEEPQAVANRSAGLRMQSSRRIRFWWVTAMFIGLIVITATVWDCLLYTSPSPRD